MVDYLLKSLRDYEMSTSEAFICGAEELDFAVSEKNNASNVSDQPDKSLTARRILLN